jgi:hypothetical protein
MHALPRTFSLTRVDGSALEVRVVETSYQEGGLGWRTWGAAAELAAQLARGSPTVAGRSVLGKPPSYLANPPPPPFFPHSCALLPSS